ncbi:hypothetical protein ACKUB1_15950 [Methanospirillum stamsii]|uniref:Uncharacterized protein n=1 Tax=Methanospirillum stamsii TaxID=1277351 RepID=A0A2V2N205_9EURY|nr:hypothetical protein [Methanospirillum stamsii]PWR71756.1 hypothetical protein DLD82_13480 [Methanospirillum stamsii]
MNLLFKEISLIALTVLSLTGSMILSRNIWFIYPLLIIFSLFIWNISRNAPHYRTILFLFIIFDSYVSYYSSPFLSILIIWSGVMLFAIQENLIVTKMDIRIIVILLGMIALTGIIIMHTNRILYPSLFVLGLSAGIIFLSIIFHYRIQKRYSGEYS